MDFDPALEPRPEGFGGWDIAIITLGIVVYMADIAALTFMYRKQQHYLPFRSKNMGVFVLAQCCGALYWVFEYVYMATHYGDRPRVYCFFVGPLLGFGLGLFTYMILLNYRLYLFVWLMVIKRSARSVWFHICFVPVYLPTILFIVASAASHSLVSTAKAPNPGLCYFSVAYRTFLTVNACYLVIVSITLGILSRKVRKTFVAYWETLISAAACIILVALNGIGNSRYLSGPGWGRFLLTLAVLIVVNIYFWSTVSYPLYCYFFRRQEYLEEFNARLAQDRLDELARSDITPLSAQSNSATNHGSRDEAPQNADRNFFSDKASIDRVFNPRHSGFQPLPFDKKSSFLV
ncbi:hypothetical protein IWQ62_000170 [Dispira parvispora]|uniref:Uncharacterized protein n=1 Tax=Dispira parvispora TaxID=1520584 RepID=A0A9W8AYY8_9FUNG|nr:hypothetical protein IWQ62_000170 [Dispira parvispora]